MRQEAENARNEAFSKTGEISIIRANRAKERDEEEKRLNSERKARSEEQARYEAEVQHYKSELQKISTDKAFIENDLVREAGQRKTTRKSSKLVGKSEAIASESTMTAKKNKDLPYGDGFSDEEVQIASPSRLALRSKPSTPKAGAKRKRKQAENSPIKPLQLSQSGKDQAHHQPKTKSMNDPFRTTTESHKEVAVIDAPLRIKQDDRFKLVQRILNHRIAHGDNRSIEALAEFSLP